MNKTIYIRDEDMPVWDKARELAGDKLAPVIVSGLKRFVAEKEAEPGGFERIEVRYNDSDDHLLPKAKAFYGKWIFPPDNPLRLVDDEDEYESDCYCVAITPKGSAVVFSWSEHTQFGGSSHRFVVYPSLADAAADPHANYAARRAIAAIGVPVEVLDI
jgi:hypothetical protein